VLASTVRLAISISIAGSHTLIAIFCAYEVWEGLGKLGNVGGHSIPTDARICKGVLSKVTPMLICMGTVCLRGSNRLKKWSKMMKFVCIEAGMIVFV